jgi:PAS domain S-box-containing protein
MPALQLLLLGPFELRYGDVPLSGPATVHVSRGLGMEGFWVTPAVARRCFNTILRVALILFLLLTSLYNPTPARAQARSPRFTHLTSDDGLSNNRVLRILQDDRGYMWFGTHDGLNRYDGYTIITYRHRRSDPQSLSDNTIYALYEDRAGTLWVGTTVGLDSFTGQGEQFVHHAAIGEQVRAIYEDAAGMLWIGTSASGLWSYDRATGQFFQYLPDPADPHSLSADSITSIYEDSAGTLWVGTVDGGLDALGRSTDRASGGGKFAHYWHDPQDPHSLSYDYVTAIYEDHRGVLWVGTASQYEPQDGGLNAFDRTTGQFTRYHHDPNDRLSLSNNQVQAIYEDRAGGLWVGTMDGLNVLDRATGTFARYYHDPLDPRSLTDNSIATIYEDPSGLLWFGTDTGGINKYAPSMDKFVRYQHDPSDPNSLSDAPVGAIFEDHNGNLWIGTYGAGLDRLDRRSGQFTHYTHDPDDPDSLGNDYIRALCEDAEGMLWVGTVRGLDRLDPATGHFQHYVHDPDDPDSPSPGAVKVILEDHTGALWIGMEEPGNLDKFDRASETFTRYEYDPERADGFINTYGVRAIYEDQAGDLWLGTYSGLVHFNRDSGAFTQYRPDPSDPYSLSHDFVWSICEEPAGILWIATSGGLNRFDRSSGQFTVYTVEDGLAGNAVAGILSDEQGYLWIGTDGGGLSRFDPRTGVFRNYDVSNGLTSNAIMLAVYYQSEQGEMFFGTANGVNAFYPGEVKDNDHVPAIVLTVFRVFDQAVEFEAALSEVEEITLSYRDNFFSFEFAALDYTDPSKNQYTYQLEGFDRGWIYCGSRRFASYTNLRPGTYTFRVKGTNNDGVWNETGHTVRITITPPFWETWWFRIVVGTAGLGILYAVVRARMRTIAVLRGSEERFRAMFENAPLCVFELDVAQSPPRIIRANRQGGRVFGWPEEELAGALLDRVFPPDAWPAVQKLVSTLKAGETTTIASAGLRRDGTVFPVRVSATGEPGPDLRRVILTVEDTTAEKERRSEEEAIAEERRRIAREIHDGLAQDLAGLRFRVRLWHNLVDGDPAQMHTELDGLQELLGKNIREVRRSIFALRPVALDELGFYPALHQFANEFAEQNQLHIDLRIEGPAEQLPGFLEPVLFRLIQEALNNVGKHAQAQMVWLVLDLTSPDAVALRIRDDGVGFDPAILEQVARHGHFGLKQMRERVERLHGTLDLHSQRGRGTEIHAVLPLRGG